MLAPSPLLQWHQFNYVDGGKGEPRMKREAEFSSLSLDHLGFAGSEDRNSPPFFSSPPIPHARCLLLSHFPLLPSHAASLFLAPFSLATGGRHTDARWSGGVQLSSTLFARSLSPPLPPPIHHLPARRRTRDRGKERRRCRLRPTVVKKRKRKGRRWEGVWSPLFFSSPTSDGRRRSRRPKLEGREEEVEGEQ